MVKEQNIEYAIYDKNDNYIAGFSSLTDMSEYLGNSKPTLSKIMSRNSDRRGEVMRFKTDQNCYDCSQKIFTYINQIKNMYGESLGKGCSIFKFWEEN